MVRGDPGHKSDAYQPVQPSTGLYARDKSKFVAWAGAALGMVALGAAGFAHGKLWSHEVSIERIDERLKAGEQRFNAGDARQDRIEAKLDRILEEVRRRP